MDKRFLLTYYCEDNESCVVSDFEWYSTEEEMRKDIEVKERSLWGFEVIEAFDMEGAMKIEL